jgi:hypothetical protein
MSKITNCQVHSKLQEKLFAVESNSLFMIVFLVLKLILKNYWRTTNLWSYSNIVNNFFSKIALLSQCTILPVIFAPLHSTS